MWAEIAGGEVVSAAREDIPTESVAYARGTDKYDAHPDIRRAVNFAEFRAAVLRDRSRRKGLQYVTAPFKTNGDGRAHRCMDDVLPRCWIPFDLDAGCIADMEMLLALNLFLMRYQGVGWLTHTHKPETPRARIILAVDRDLTRDEGMRLGIAFEGEFRKAVPGLGTFDRGVYRGEQPVYCPPVGAEAFLFDGESVCADEVLANAPEIPPEGSSKSERAEQASITDPVLKWLYERGMVLGKADAGKFSITCPFESNHSSKTSDSATVYFLPHFGGVKYGKFHCFHVHCANRAQKDYLRALGLDPLKVWKEQAGNESATGNGKPRDSSASDWPLAMDLLQLKTAAPEPPKFIIPDWLPEGYATLLAGHGGVGKSGIALSLAVCMAAGVPFFGLPIARRRVLYLSCEDREGLLHWRLSRICRHMGIDMGELAGWLQVLDLVGRDTVLWSPSGPMPAFYALQARAAEADVLMVDGVSDTFAGNENDRGHVKQYSNTLLSLIKADTGALVLIGHVAKISATNVTTSEGYSGSTGWHNAVRARWYLYPEAEPGSPSERTGDLLMDLQKSNLGRSDQSMRFTWDNEQHMFIGQWVRPETAGDRSARAYREREAICRALEAVVTSGNYCPAAATGNRTAYIVLSVQGAFPDSLKGGAKAQRTRFWEHIEHLRAIKRVGESSIRRDDRHRVAILVPGTEE